MILAQSVHYNRLPGVLEANNALNRAGRNTLMQELATVILEHGLEETIGLRLIHAHNGLDDDELMVEREEIDTDGRPCLVTAPIRYRDMDGTMQPNSWDLGESGFFIPVEYSVFAAPPPSDDVLRPVFVDLKRVIESRGAVGVIGPWIVPQDDPFSDRGDDHILIEVTDTKRRANILRMVPRSEAPITDTVETTWRVKRGECTDASGLLVHGTCVTEYVCWSRPGGHDRTTRHR